VGPEKRRALLNAFGSVQGVREAGIDAIAQLPGFSTASAQRLLAALNPQADTSVPAETVITAPGDSVMAPEPLGDVMDDTSAPGESASAMSADASSPDASPNSAPESEILEQG
jgi:hypothetical protein